MKGIDTNSANVIKMIAAGGNRRMRRRQIEGKSFKAKEGGPLFFFQQAHAGHLFHNFLVFCFVLLSYYVYSVFKPMRTIRRMAREQLIV